MVQLATYFGNNQGELNEILRSFQRDFPKRKIINVNVQTNEPVGWFMIIVYEINM